MSKHKSLNINICEFSRFWGKHFDKQSKRAEITFNDIALGQMSLGQISNSIGKKEMHQSFN